MLDREPSTKHFLKPTSISSWITSYVAHPFLMNILVKTSGSSFSTLEVERWKVRAASEFELTFRGKQVKSNSLDANCEGSK